MKKRLFILMIPAIIGIITFIIGAYMVETNPIYKLEPEHAWYEEFNDLPDILLVGGCLLICISMILLVRDSKRLIRELRKEINQKYVQEERS